VQPLIDAHELIGILERGLEGGLWSIAQFNAKAANPVLPRKEFLEEHPQFLDMNYRDMNAFNSRQHNIRL
jgi:hypothetical protein